MLGSSIGQIGYDAITTTANMAPTIVASTLANEILPGSGEIAGTALMGASAGGNKYQELLNTGMNKDQARALAIVSGVWEGASEYFLGQIEGLAGKGISNALSKTQLVQKVRLSSNALTKALFDFFGDASMEGMEEVIQDIGESIITGVMTDKWEFSSLEDQAYNFVLGALTAAVMNAPSSISETASNVIDAREVKRTNGGVEALKNLGNTFSADTVAYQLAGKVDENTSPLKLARLIDEIGGTISDQNQSDIQHELELNGIDEDDAKTIAEWLNKAVDGYNFTRSQQKALESNPTIAKVFYDVIVDRNSTVNQRLQNKDNLIDRTGSTYGVDLKALAESQSRKALGISATNTMDTLARTGMSYDELSSDKESDVKKAVERVSAAMATENYLKSKEYSRPGFKSIYDELDNKTSNAIKAIEADTVRNGNKAVSNVA